MGLSLIVDGKDGERAEHWSYHGFGQFRAELYSFLWFGNDLSDKVGYGGRAPWSSPDKEPLVYLFDHSDCDGELSSHEAEAIAIRLREVMDTRPVPDGLADEIRRLARLLEYAADNGSKVVFA